MVNQFPLYFDLCFELYLHYQSEVHAPYTMVCLYNYEFGLSLCKIVRSSVILLLPLFTITMPNVTAGGIVFPRGHCNLVALLKQL